MSSNFKYTAGLNNVGSYQVSGRPYAKGGLDATAVAEAISISFPYVTKWVTIINHENAHLKVAFSENGLDGDQYFRVGPQTGNEHTQNVTLNVKVTELWFTGSSGFDVIAGLTGIAVERINNLSGSDGIVGNNWSGSSGVG